MANATRLKVCCIANIAEARMAIDAGATAIGLVSRMPSGPGVISEDRIAEIAAHVPTGVATFLLTSLQSANDISDQVRRLGVNTVQICDHLEHGDYADIRLSAPGVRIVQVVHVSGQSAVNYALKTEPLVDAVLLDSGNQQLTVKQLGGTGRPHDWRLSREICEQVAAPVYLAGGLTPLNVSEAIDLVQPFGVDVCSGVRTDGQLDAKKLAQFARAVFRT